MGSYNSRAVACQNIDPMNAKHKLIYKLSELPSEEALKNCRILVVGDVMLDKYWMGQTLRISPEAPVPVVKIDDQENRLGAAANVARNAKSLGATVTLLGLIGADDAGLMIQEKLKELDINNELIVTETMQTIIKLRIVSQGQQLARIDFEKIPDRESKEKIARQYKKILLSYDLIIFSDYGKGALSHVKSMIDIAKKYSKKTLVDPKGKTWENYAGVDIVTPNNTELMEVIGAVTTEKKLEKLVIAKMQALHIKNILVTRAERGMVLINNSGSVKIRAKEIEVSDVTGAGDTVIATLAVMIASGMSVLDATRWANEAAGRVVSKFGTSTINRRDLLEINAKKRI